MMKRIYNFTAESRNGITIYTGSLARRDTDRRGYRRGESFVVIADEIWSKTIIELYTWDKGHEASRETVAEICGYVVPTASVATLLAAHGVL